MRNDTPDAVRPRSPVHRSRRSLALPALLAMFAAAVHLHAAAVGWSPRQAAAPPKAATERIVYTTLQPYNLDIYLNDGSTSGWTQLTTDQANDYNPVFSPDGRWAVFTSERLGNPDLFVIDLRAGGSPRPLTSSPAMEDAPDFSPDGRWLTFVSDRDGNADIFIMPFTPDDSSGDRRAVNLTSYPGGDFNPSFSPDGTRIAFTSERHLPPRDARYWSGYPSGGDVYVMGVGGEDVRRLTWADGWDGAPAWSANGERILFYSERDGARRIWSMRPDGKDQRSVSPASLRNALFAVSAPGDRVGFSDGGKIYTVGVNGTGLEQLAAAETDLGGPAFHGARVLAHGDGPVKGRVLREDGRPFAATGTTRTVTLPDRSVEVFGIYPSFPAFGPDGEQIVSSHSVPGERGRRALVVAHRDGTDSRTIYRGEGQIFSTTWSPDGKWIIWAEGVVFAPEGVNVDLWRVRPDGTDAQNLTPSAWNDAFPDVDASGRIVFRSGRDGNKQIYLMNSDGGNPRRLTSHSGVATMPALSPDGSWVAFSSDQLSPPGSGDLDVLLLQLGRDGTPGSALPAWLPGLSVLAGGPGPDVHPRFAPDGQWVVYASAASGLNDEPALFDGGPQPYGEIWAVPVAPYGPPGPPVRLTHNKWEDSLADWSSPMKVSR